MHRFTSVVFKELQQKKKESENGGNETLSLSVSCLSALVSALARPLLTQFLACFNADRGKDKSQGTTKPVNKGNSATAKVTASNGNGAVNRWASFSAAVAVVLITGIVS